MTPSATRKPLKGLNLSGRHGCQRAGTCRAPSRPESGSEKAAGLKYRHTPYLRERWLLLALGLLFAHHKCVPDPKLVGVRNLSLED